MIKPEFGPHKLDIIVATSTGYPFLPTGGFECEGWTKLLPAEAPLKVSIKDGTECELVTFPTNSVWWNDHLYCFKVLI